MKHFALSLLALALLVRLAPLFAAPMQDSSGLVIQDSHGFALGSFEAQADLDYIRVTAYRERTLDQLRAHQISKAQAQKRQAIADKVRALLDQGVAACQQSAATAICMGNETMARTLLGQARAAMPKDMP